MRHDLHASESDAAIIQTIWRGIIKLAGLLPADKIQPRNKNKCRINTVRKSCTQTNALAG